ncbi:hypothetical protein TWF696_008257 [Orbilia brochopaga]|uniref:N-acetylglucosamine-induced protein 1 n=1 Tax=Orbilia brochopaga TaxID=3140254 RepID=A0AAV9UJ90_9PEZI
MATTTITQPPKTDAYIPTVKDQEILNTPDHLFHLHSWSDLRTIIAENRLEDLKRRPSDLRRYLDWGQQTRQEYGSVLRYILQRRLFWEEGNIVPKSDIPFAEEEDTRILFNDWPYGLADGIVHIVVWTKAAIPIDDSGDITPASRTLIVDFVNRVFVTGLGLPAEKVLWFKNWAALQSVRTVEHIHVLVDTSGIDGAMEKLRTVAK